jgi:hypothetical protein
VSGRPPKGEGPRRKRDYKTTDADHARLKGEAKRRDLASVNDLLANIAITFPEAGHESR